MRIRFCYTAYVAYWHEADYRDVGYRSAFEGNVLQNYFPDQNEQY
jgi:hypothetical protein